MIQTYKGNWVSTQGMIILTGLSESQLKLAMWSGALQEDVDYKVTQRAGDGRDTYRWKAQEILGKVEAILKNYSRYYNRPRWHRHNR